MKCQFYNCRFPAEKGKRYCGGHYKMMGDEVLPGKEDEKPEEVAVAKTGIAQFSKKRAKEDRLYKKEVRQELQEGIPCVVKSPICTYWATGMNHKQKKTMKNLRQSENKEPCCDPCNLYIEMHPTWAKEHGHQISRFQTLTEEPPNRA